MHIFNKTPIDWFTKLQATVETATFGSEFVAGRTCVEQVITLRTMLRYLGVPLSGPSMIFGDNESVVNASVIPHYRLHKRHVLLSFHRVREAMAAGFAKFFHIAGAMNPSDVLSKHWAYSDVWEVLRPLLFWKGDTRDIPVRESAS